MIKRASDSSLEAVFGKGRPVQLLLLLGTEPVAHSAKRPQSRRLLPALTAPPHSNLQE